MAALAKPLAFLAAIAFMGAVITHFTGPIAGFAANTFSRSCSNLALIAIALAVAERAPNTPPTR